MYKHYRNNHRPQRQYRPRFDNSKNQAEVLRAIRILQTLSVTESKTEEIAYSPKYTFLDFAISDSLKRNITNKNYLTPTPIQDQAIPMILEGQDLIGIANTGTGKTASFLIPLVEKVTNNRNEKILIITPTRELAMQIKDELREFSEGMGINWALCVGGMDARRQLFDLQRRPNFIIGTPGRLKDFSQRGNLNLSTFTTVVLDEADRMVDMGFIGDVHYFSLLPYLKK
jgi:superfamily II DNA/RNA helicase